MSERKRIAIVNKIYWPDGHLIGEALLAVTKKLIINNDVVVVAQTKHDHADLLKDSLRGNLVFDTCQPRSNSTSSILLRIYDAVMYMFFVFSALVRNRPHVVYVATNPPIIVPFIVYLYSKFFGAKYLYHVQDIHPEASALVMPMNRIVISLLRFLDTVTLRNAAVVVTLTEQMKNYLINVRRNVTNIVLIDNPANEVDDDEGLDEVIEDQIIYAGSMGRFQRIQLVVDSIKEYLNQGGRLRFLFCGDGIFARKIESLAGEFENVAYLGAVKPAEAARLTKTHKWALLPIDDEVTEFAFPCKSSTYVASGCNVFAICSEGTAVAEWVNGNNVGIVASPDVRSIVGALNIIEKSFNLVERQDASYFHEKFSMHRFSLKIAQILEELT